MSGRWNFNVGDLVRYRQGRLDEIGVIVDDANKWGDYEIRMCRTGNKGICNWRYLEKLS